MAVRDTKNKLLRLYVNGVLLPSTNPDSHHYDGIDRTGSISNPRELFIGDASRRDNPFKGDIDDIRIFRSALSMHQVAALAKRMKPAMKNARKAAETSLKAATNHKKAAAIPPRAPRPFAVPSLLAHWPLNYKKGTVVKEVVGGHNGELTNADTAVSWISGKRGGALQLDGVNDRIFVPHNLAFDFAEESFTAAFWMRWKKCVAPHSQHFLTKGDYHSAAPNQTGKRWEIFVSGRNSMCFTIDDDVVASRIQVPLEPFITGKWVHVVAIRDMAKKQLQFYANGVPLLPTNPEKAAIDGVDRTGSIANPQRLTIGDAYLCDNPFAGDMDDIRIYLGTLTERQIADMATLAVQASPGAPTVTPAANSFQRPRVIITSDAEIDDECSFVRCLLYANDFDIEGIISTSSQYHAHDHKWAGDNWYVKYLDAYTYPEGRWYTSNAWGRNRIKKKIKNDAELTAYLKPIWRWMEAFQNDFASRADWCVKSYKEANHPPVVVLAHAADLEVRPGAKVKLSARGTSDPDKDKLKYRWWQYREAGSYDGTIEIRGAGKQNALFTVPGDAGKGKTIHVICEVTDNGAPPITRYQRVVVEIE